MIDELVKAVDSQDWESARLLLYRHWGAEAPKVFAPPEKAFEYSNDEAAIASTFLVPVAMAYCGTVQKSVFQNNEGSPDPSLVLLNEQAGTTPGQRRAGQICGYVFKEGEPTFSCRECAVDPTCVLCQECFDLSVHKNHKYRMYTSAGSGYCDCGDRDAWRKGYACDIHAEDQSGELVPHSLPVPLSSRLRMLTVILLEYAVRMMTWDKDRSLTTVIPCTKSVSSRPYQTILYNDETHTYDSVIRALELAVHYTKEQAMMLATFVDKEGRTSVFAGSETQCNRISGDIRRRTQRDHNRRTDKTGPLEVQMFETELVAHQNLAIAFVQWLSGQIGVFPMLAELVGNVLLEERYVERRKGNRTDEESEDKMEVDEDDDESMHDALSTPPPPPTPTTGSAHSAAASPPSTTAAAADAGVHDDDWIGEETNLVELVMLADRSLWKQARSSWHQLFMRTVLMNMDQKLEFSRKFLKLYEKLHSEFIEDDQEHDVSIVSISVQMLTVPPIARSLIADNCALAHIFRVLLRFVEKYVTTDRDGQGNMLPVPHRRRFDFSGRTYPATLKRAMHMMRDQVYMLTQIPTKEEWTDPLRENFLEGFKELVRLLDLMQGMDEVKRLEAEHQVWEQEWETAFNMQLRLQEMITLMLAWARSDMVVHRRALLIVIEAVNVVLREQPPVEVESGQTHQMVQVGGVRHAVKFFDVMKHPVSIHQPIFRLLTGLMTVPEEMNRYLQRADDAKTDDEIAARKGILELGSELWDMQLRVLVLCAQAAAQLWRRNGFSLINQVHNYFSPLCRMEMFDQDLTMLQLGAALTPPSEFLLQTMFRYRISTWAEPNFEGMIRSQTGGRNDQEEMSKVTVMLAEEFFTLIINIISERYRPGVGKCTRLEMLEREVVHQMAAGPQPFSHIQSRMHSDPLLYRVSLNESVTKIGQFRRQTSSGPGKFELKEGYLERYDAFFYHFSRSGASAAEQYQRKLRANKERKLRACPPPPPIPFEPLFEPVRDLLLSPVLMRAMTTTLERNARRNRFSSEGLLHRVLYLIGLSLHEQYLKPVEFDYLALANSDEVKLLPKLEALVNTPESQPHEDLLWWTIQKFKEVEASKTAELRRREGAATTVAAQPMTTEEKDEDEKVGNEEAEKRRKEKAAKAAKMREAAMKQMSKMQKTFMEQTKKEEEAEGEKKEGDKSASPMAESETETRRKEELRMLYDEDDDCPIIGTDAPSSFPVCIGPTKHVVEEVHPRTVTCVLCQESESLTAENGHRFVCAALVQRSQLFTQRVPSAKLGLESFIVNSSLDGEKETSTCSHTMHYECYQNLYDQTIARDRVRTRQQMLHSQKVIDADAGEYLCPLCKRLSNTALPLLPPTQLLSIPGFSSNRTPPEDETFESWTAEIRRFVALTKPKHSRKRSHSERSLLDLTRQADREGVDQLAQGSLEAGLSTSVPSASEMNLLIADEAMQQQSMLPPLPAVDQDEEEDERERQRERLAEAQRILGERRVELEARVGAFEIELVNGLPAVVVPRNEGGQPEVEGEPAQPRQPNMREIFQQVNQFFENEERDDEIMVLLRGAMAVGVGEVDAAEEAAVEEVLREVRAEGERQREAAARDEAQLLLREAMQRQVRRRGIQQQGRQGNELAEAVRRVHAIPTMLSGIIKTLPAAVQARFGKRIVPLSMMDVYEEPVRNFAKYLIKMQGDAPPPSDEASRCFSCTVAVWRTTTHTVRTISSILAVEGKPLFGALNTRQRDCLYSLARLSAFLSCNLAPFGEIVRIMLRMLLHQSVANPYAAQARSGIVPLLSDAVKTAASPSTSSAGPSDRSESLSAPMSPPPVYNCHPLPKVESRDKDPAKRGRAAAAAIAMFFSTEKKERTFHILHIDILSLTMELMMCIGWTWHDGARTAKASAPPTKELVPDGSADELHVMRLGLIAFHFQVLATFVDSPDTDMESEQQHEEQGLEARVEELWKAVRPEGKPLRNGRALLQALRSSTITFLRPLALLYQSLRLVSPPEALRDPSVDQFDPLCRFMGLPHSLKELLSSPVVDELFEMWAPCIPEDITEVPRQPFRARQLVDLPKDFSQLITTAARFRCPSIPIDEKSTMPTMCLLCGQVLCSQSYCCQKQNANKESVGACMQHIPTCSGANGAFLRIRDCTVVLLTNRLRGCLRAAPYVDEFGEVDQGFRRGNPLHLNAEMYAKLRNMWLHQGIAEEIVNRYEIDHRNIAYEWNHF